MLKSLELENYRCFEKTKVIFKDIVIIAGKNNAGKSTMIEALRMVAYACRKSIKTNYQTAPFGLEISQQLKGIKIDVDKLKIDLRGIIHFYDESKYAVIKAEMNNGCKVVVKLNHSNAFAVIYDAKGNNIKTKVAALANNLNCISILPQIGLIKENEKLLERSTIENSQDTYLSSRHFRNEILLHKSEFWNEFKQLVEETWHGLELDDLRYDFTETDYIQLYVRDESFTSEIGFMGSGLQMWLQIMWFLCRTKENETVILDEPDVYMHPDLQLRLYHLITERYPQVIIATHSVEILSEAEPKNVVVLEKESRRLRYANSMKAVQTLIDNMGGIQNLSIIRLGTIKKCLFVEGDDLKLLKKLTKIISKKSDRLELLPTVTLYGFCNWEETLGASKLFQMETKGEIKCYCIIDSDYYPQEELDKIRNRAVEGGLNLHIWNKKELENYFIIPRAIFRLTGLEMDKYDDFLLRFDSLLDSKKEDIIYKYADQIRRYNLQWEPSTCHRKASSFVEEKWTSIEKKLSLVSGKEFIKEINAWMRAEYKVSCSLDKICSKIKAEEIDSEIYEVIDRLI